MLDGRAKALETKDVSRFLEPLVPEARPTEATLGQGGALSSLADVRIELKSRPTTKANELSQVPVEFEFGYAGLAPDNRFRFRLSYDLGRRGTKWKILSSRFISEKGLPPWATGPIETTRSDHFIVFWRPGLADAAQTIERAERAREALIPKLSLMPDEAHLMLLARNRAEYEQMSGRVVPASSIAQAETIYAISDKGVTTEGRLILVNLEAAGGESEATQVLQHELAHLALASRTRPFTPAWVSESAALFLSDARPTSQWRRGIRQEKFDKITFAELNRAAVLGAHNPAGDATFEYAYAAAAAYYLIETFGQEKYWAFYSSYAEISSTTILNRVPDPSPGDPATDTALIALGEEHTRAAMLGIFGFDEHGLDQRVRDWIRRAVRADIDGLIEAA